MDSRESDSSNKRLCECGCGKEVKKGNVFVNGHNAKIRTRENNPNWNGGIMHTSEGYIRILKPEHKRADRNGYVAEHILVYEEYYNCCVLETGNIHHINGVKVDNRIENLELKSKSDHLREHRKEEIKNGKTMFGGIFYERYHKRFLTRHERLTVVTTSIKVLSN